MKSIYDIYESVLDDEESKIDYAGKLAFFIHHFFEDFYNNNLPEYLSKVRSLDNMYDGCGYMTPIRFVECAAHLSKKYGGDKRVAEIYRQPGQYIYDAMKVFSHLKKDWEEVTADDPHIGRFTIYCNKKVMKRLHINSDDVVSYIKSHPDHL